MVKRMKKDMSVMVKGMKEDMEFKMDELKEMMNQSRGKILVWLDAGVVHVPWISFGPVQLGSNFDQFWARYNE